MQLCIQREGNVKDRSHEQMGLCASVAHGHEMSRILFWMQSLMLRLEGHYFYLSSASDGMSFAVSEVVIDYGLTGALHP